jgi:hypothetical protein
MVGGKIDVVVGRVYDTRETRLKKRKIALNAGEWAKTSESIKE